MSYKSIAVHLDLSGRAQIRLDVALRLARQFEAHLTGILATFSPEWETLDVRAGSIESFREREQWHEEKRAALERAFREETARAKVPSDWIFTDTLADIAMPHYARYADLVVAGQHQPDDPDGSGDAQFQENLVLSSGRPVLFLPYVGDFPSLGERVLVAWDGSREAVRAAHDAIPFLECAKRSTVLTITDADAGRGGGARPPGADAALMLSRHAPNVDEQDIIGSPDGSVGELLLSRACDMGADLLVMGAYGHTRMRERVLGGATRTILQSMTVPVLMSH